MKYMKENKFDEPNIAGAAKTQEKQDVRDIQSKLRNLPAIERLLLAVKQDRTLSGYPRALLAEAARAAVSEVRDQLRQGIVVDLSLQSLLRTMATSLHCQAGNSLKRAINATGVVMHTNLGRAPLSERACAAVQQVMTGYSTLEYDLDSGGRGTRYSHVEEKICRLTGAEAAIVVNNNAAAVLLALSTMASGREVVVSRGQLVEVGGSFRIPDVMQQSGAKLVEVGSTNKTHLADYEQAIRAETAAILKVHTSNYRIIGFTSQPESRDLVYLAHEHDIPVIDDLGSGNLLPFMTGDWQEPIVGDVIKAGIDVVTFSGDKLLGAGQAGIIAGRVEYLAKMRRNPLLRALRIDKLSLAALEGTLLDYIIGNACSEVPVQRMLHQRPEELHRQALLLADLLEPLKGVGWTISVISLESQAGGGSLPAIGLKSYGVSIGSDKLSAAALERFLRVRSIPIIVRIHNNKVLFDVRCLLSGDREEIVVACQDAQGSPWS